VGDRIVFHALVGIVQFSRSVPYYIHRIETVAYPPDLLAQCSRIIAMPVSGRCQVFQGLHSDGPRTLQARSAWGVYFRPSCAIQSRLSAVLPADLPEVATHFPR
jgi:hypothetical protein